MYNKPKKKHKTEENPISTPASSKYPQNPSVPFFPHNPQQREARYPPKSLASIRIPKTLEGDHHHIANTIWSNPIHPRLRKDPMPQA